MKGRGHKIQGRSRRGVAAVEFALIMPILAVLSLATIEFGWYFSHKARVVDVARESIRYAATLDPNTIAVFYEGTRILQQELKANGVEFVRSEAYIRQRKASIEDYDLLLLRAKVHYWPISDILGVSPRSITTEMSMLSRLKREPRKPYRPPLRPPIRAMRPPVASISLYPGRMLRPIRPVVPPSPITRPIKATSASLRGF